MVTPEMLLWLAGKMGLPTSSERCGPCVFVRSDGDETWSIFNPATDDAQFGRLVAWAAMQGMVILKPNMCEMAVQTEHCQWKVGTIYNDNSTPDSIRAAAVVAICRALGYQEAANGL